MNERSRNFIVGLTTLSGVLGLMALLLLFGYVPRFMQSGYFITVEYSDAAGLNPGSRVALSGIDIGSVESVSFKQPAGSGVSVRARIREGVRIPLDSSAVVEKPLLGGSPTIRFIDDNPHLSPAGFLKTDGSSVVRGSQGALAGAFGELARLTNSFDALSSEWQGVGRKVNAMLAAQDLHAVERGEVAGNLTTVVARIDRRLAEFKEVLAGVDSLINDPVLREDVAATTANLRKASGEVSGTMKSLQTRYVALADDVAGTLAQMQAMLKAANEGQGTVGKLVTDPALYNSLEDAAQRIGSAADELKLLIEKWKAEGVPVSM